MRRLREPAAGASSVVYLFSIGKMKVIFLDVDGVLCTMRSHFAFDEEGTKWKAWDPLACAVIGRACSKGVKLVISSSWRYPRHTPALFEALDEHALVPYLNMPDWKTPDFGLEDRQVVCRGDEIADYLGRHTEIRSYRILDDTCDFWAPQMPFLIETHPDEGMSSQDIKKLLNWSGALKS